MKKYKTIQLKRPVGDRAFDAAVEICDRLRAAGHEAYLVGGAVRDLLLIQWGRTSKKGPLDYDITTSARPEQIKRIFKKTLDVGIKFGVIKVRMNGMFFEVATFRGEAGYYDGRHPSKVWFSTLEEDLKRRDFTVNTLILDVDGFEIRDYTGGIEDLKKGIIRAVGVPVERFKEDRLRMLRAVRFAAQLDFEVEMETFNAIVALSDRIVEVSKERIREEWEKLLKTDRPEKGIELSIRSDLIYKVFPHIEHIDSNRLMQLAKCIKYGESLSSKWAIFLYDMGKDVAARALIDLKDSKKRSVEVGNIIWLMNRLKGFRDLSLAEQKRLLRTSEFKHALSIALKCNEVFGIDKRDVDTAFDMHNSLSYEELFPEPLINGNDLVSLGFKRGPVFKEILEAVEDAQLNNIIKDRDEALHFVIEHFKDRK